MTSCKNGAPREETRHFSYLIQRLPAISEGEAEASEAAASAPVATACILRRAETGGAANGAAPDIALIMLSCVIVPVIEFGRALDDEAAFADLLDMGRAAETGVLIAISVAVKLELAGAGIGGFVGQISGLFIGLTKGVELRAVVGAVAPVTSPVASVPPVAAISAIPTAFEVTTIPEDRWSAAKLVGGHGAFDALTDLSGGRWGEEGGRSQRSGRNSRCHDTIYHLANMTGADATLSERGDVLRSFSD